MEEGQSGDLDRFTWTLPRRQWNPTGHSLSRKERRHEAKGEGWSLTSAPPMGAQVRGRRPRGPIQLRGTLTPYSPTPHTTYNTYIQPERMRHENTPTMPEIRLQFNPYPKRCTRGLAIYLALIACFSPIHCKVAEGSLHAR